MGTRKGLLILAGAGILTLIVGICVVQFWGRPMLDEAKQSEYWPSAGGVILSSRVKELKDGSGNVEYVADVHYYYYVGDQKHEGADIWFGGNPPMSEIGRPLWMVGRYPRGAKVPVYYNPDKPEVAVLQPGAPVSYCTVWFVGWVIAVVGGLAVVAALCKWLIKMSHAVFS